MMRSLYSGVTGLRNHQTRMDVIGNNIANVNTVGYKASRVVFQDIYSQTLQSASGASATIGGTNPRQIGLGVSLAAIDILHTPSASQYTGAPLDLAIEGDGFFILHKEGQEYYTRAGNFGTDGKHNLVNSNGFFVQGFEVDAATGALKKDTDGNNIMTNIVIDPKYYDVSIDKDGVVTGLDRATDQKVFIAVVASATFANNPALEKVGSNMYRKTTNSGAPEYTTPGVGGAGQLNPGSLEMSNVDLAGEFTDLIVTQRGFQANSRTITTTDQMLEEIVNLKR